MFIPSLIHNGKSETMKLGYILKYVNDVSATVIFYEAAFGIKARFIHESGTYAEMETGSTALGFVDAKFAAGNGAHFETVSLEKSPPGIEVGFISNDVAKSYEKAIAAGAIAIVNPTQKPWGQIVSYVRDLNGFLVEICSTVE